MITPIKLLVSFDGGGIRGALGARAIWHLSRTTPAQRESWSAFHHPAVGFAGTSVGALIAAALADNQPPVNITDMFSRDAKHIFKRRAWPLGGLFWGPKYSDRGRLEACTRMVGKKLWRDLSHPCWATAYDLESRRSELIGPDCDRPAVDVMMASSDAPTYFAAWHGRIDGGVFENNPVPAVASYIAAPLRVLSFGSGCEATERAATSRSYAWSALHWAPHLVDLFMSANSTTPNPPQVIEKRCQFPLPGPVALDEISAVPDLFALADRWAESEDFVRTVEFIKESLS